MITIIEKEILLANDISDKLKKSGYKTEVFACINKAIKFSTGDVYLLSTVFPLNTTKTFIQKFKVLKIKCFLTGISIKDKIFRLIKDLKRQHIIKNIHRDRAV